MGKSELFLVCLAALIGIGSALQCYTCKSDVIDDCKTGSSKLEKVSCGLEHPNLLQFCIYKVVFDKEQKKDIFYSSCESFRKPVARPYSRDDPPPEPIVVLDRNVQQCQPNQKFDVKQCEVCNTDLCNYYINSAPVPKFSFMTFLYLPVLYLFTKFILR